MLDRIRRRLTLGYVGIFALILTIIGSVVVASFARQAAGQQDELLEQKARGDADFVAGPLLRHYQEERKGGPPGPFLWATDQDLGMVALVPGEANGEEGTVLDSTSSASSFGLPFDGPARKAAEEWKTIEGTYDGPEGEMVRW